MVRKKKRVCPQWHDSLAEWSKALASGASPKGRGFEPHSCHFSTEREILHRQYAGEQRCYCIRAYLGDAIPITSPLYYLIH